METLLNSNWVSLVEDTLEKGDRLVLNLYLPYIYPTGRIGCPYCILFLPV